MEKSRIVKNLALIIIFVALVILVGGCNNNIEKDKQGYHENIEGVNKFPNQDLYGYIMWESGGGTDNVSRKLTSLVEKHLGRRVVLQNKPGATGAIATQFVYHSNNDGYTLLYGAENPQIYGVMGITELDYSDFETVILIGMETGIIIVAEDSKYNTLEDLIADATDNPGKVKLGTTGPGGLPFVVMSLLNTVSEAEFKQVPFDGDGPVIKALLGGHVDATITKLSAAGDFYEEGKIKILASVSNESIKEISDVPALGQIFPEYQKYLPWGPFYGVFVKKETPEEIVDILRTAYKKAFEEEDFKEFLEKSAITPIGTAGEEAEEFLLRWQSFSSWLMYDVGAAKISPDTLGIKRLD